MRRRSDVAEERTRVGRGLPRPADGASGASRSPALGRPGRTLSRAELSGYRFLATLFDERYVGLILLGSDGRVVRTNRRGREFLEEKGGLRERRDGLTAHRAGDQAAVERLLKFVQLPAQERGADVMAVTVGGWPDRPPATVYAVRAPGSQGADDDDALLVVLDPWAATPVDAKVVARALGLTVAESEVAAALAEGRNVSEIAAATGRTPSTVRGLVKQALSKTWASRQSDLVRLVLSVERVPVKQPEALLGAGPARN